MSDPSRSDADADGLGGWQLVQIAELVAHNERLGDRALRILNEVDSDLSDTAFLTVSRPDVAELSGLLLDVVQHAERLQLLAEGLPDDDVAVSYADVADAAAQELALGIIDVDRARLAARLLDRRVGWRALAEGLRHADSYTVWEETTIGDILGCFRGAAPEAVRAAAADASLTPDVEIASCDPDAIVRLAASLEQHAASLLD